MGNPAELVRWSSTEQRAIKLLAAGLQNSQAAAALGVTESRVSQMLAEENFAAEVAAAKFLAMEKRTTRDAAYDELEDTLLEKVKLASQFESRLPVLVKALQIINAARRSMTSGPAAGNLQQTVVNITIPQVAASMFTTNSNNQVISAGEQQLLTIQSGALHRMVQAEQKTKLTGEANENGTSALIRPATS